MYDWNKEPHQHKKRGSRHSTGKVERVHGPELTAESHDEEKEQARHEAWMLLKRNIDRMNKEKEEAEEKEKKKKENRSPEAIRKYIESLRPGKVDKGFYGHVEASDFKKTSIISTSGRVR
jgi:hypothetical protein